MNALERAAFRHVRSFRCEDGGLYGVCVGIYSRVYGWEMRRHHRHGNHGRLMANGHCTWCGLRAVKLRPVDESADIW